MLGIQLAKEGERTYIIFVSNISFSPLKFWLVAKIRFLFLTRRKRNDAKMKAVITSESPVINVP